MTGRNQLSHVKAVKLGMWLQTLTPEQRATGLTGLSNQASLALGFPVTTGNLRGLMPALFPNEPRQPRHLKPIEDLERRVKFLEKLMKYLLKTEELAALEAEMFNENGKEQK